MNQIPIRLRRRSAYALFALGCGLWTSSAHAQGVGSPPASSSTPSSSSSAATSEEVVELSPFTVDASKDIGYYAENTLAGSRLNTNVGDLASSITIVTKQQLDDTGALDINDVFLYEANTEGAATYTPFYMNRQNLRDQIGGTSGDDGTPFGIATANRVRGLSAADTAQNNYPTVARLAFDSYNTNTVEINRGPNSLLFGTGAASGIVNQSSSEAMLGQRKTTVVGRFGSYGAWRTSIGTNIPLGDKLAVYVAALYDSRGYRRKPSSDVYRRQYATLTYQPFAKTKITASYEHYDNYNNRPNSISPSDFVTSWLEAGRPGWNPVTQMFTFTDTGVTKGPYLLDTRDSRWTTGLPVGNAALTTRGGSLFIDQMRFNERNQLQFDAGRIIGFTVGSATTGAGSALPAAASRTQAQWLAASRRLTATGQITRPVPADPSTGATEYGVWYDKSVTDQSIYDWEKDNIAGANYGRQWAHTYNIELQQQILPNLNLSAGWFRQEYKEWDYYSLGQVNDSPRIYVDTNLLNVDGTPNNYFGSPFVLDWQADSFYRPETNDNLRGMLAYETDLTKKDGWIRLLGRHRLLGLVSRQKVETNNLRYRYSFDAGDPRFLPTRSATFSWAGGASVERHYYLGQNDHGVVEHGIQVPGEAGDGGPEHATLRFYDWTTNAFNVAEMYFHPNLFYAGDPYGITKRQTDSASFAWQGYLWDERIVPTFGWRRDDVEITQTQLSLVPNNQRYNNGFGIPGLESNLGAPYNVSGNTKTTGVVVKPFMGWEGIDSKADNGDFLSGLLRGLSFHYNKSDNFNAPPNIQTDFFGNRLPEPSGNGKDYGIGASLFDNKLVVRINWYKSTNERATANAANTAIGRMIRVDTTSGRDWARRVVRIRNGQDPTDVNFDNNTIYPLTQAQQDEIAELWQLPFDWPQTTIKGTESNVSKGMELQMIYNPLRNWNIKLTIGQQKASYSDSVGELAAWRDFRKPFWEQLRAPDLPTVYTLSNGNKMYLESYWDGYGFSSDAGSNASGGTGSPHIFYASAVENEIAQLEALEGTNSPSLREWSANLLSNYSFQEGRLRGFSVGGSLRWQDKAVAGYYGDLRPEKFTHPTATRIGIVYNDLNRPIYVPAESHLDLWVSYTTRLFEDKVRMKVQLNVRDVTESGEIRPVVFNLDGTPAQYRIIDPRQWFVTTTFDF